MSPVVLFYSESPAASAELATAAAELARRSGADAVSVDLGAPRPGAGGPGTKVVAKGSFGQDPPPEVAAEAIFRVFTQLKASAALVGATRNGRETAARLAAKLRCGCLAEVSGVSVGSGKLTGERSAYAGRVKARVECGFPAVATVKLGSYMPSNVAPATTKEVDVGQVGSTSKLLSRDVKEAGKVDLKSAKVIVSAGRGVKKKEDLQLLESLAKEMHGALGCSRPLSSDLGWLPEEHHIGLTGVSVKPDLYLAVGISGQLQHVAGIKDSKVVAAINTDKDAPIFQASDYGVVGDLYQIVPALIKALSSRR